MAPVSGKRVSLSMQKKLEILEEVDRHNLSKTELAKKYGIPKSSLSTIIKHRVKIQGAVRDLGPERSRTTPAKFPALEEALVEWMKLVRAKNVPVDANVLKAKADVFALRLGIEDFKFSDGWVQRFKTRHGLVLKKVCGESASVNMETVSTWREASLKKLLTDYEPQDVFNADETGLFFKLLPDKSLVFSGEKCSGGKKAKQRLTVLLAANMSGTEKLPLLVIGKYRNPRCFKGIRSLPAKYEANSNSWMTASIYEAWIRALDQQMTRKGRNILLIVDNCTAHVNVAGLQSITVEFLPPNVTSVAQPMDQGVIQAFKVHYRRKLLNRMVLALENGKGYEIDVLGAIHLAVASWNDVTEQTISNCFRHAGFVQTSDDSEIPMIIEGPVENEDLLMGKFISLASAPDVNFGEYVAVDSHVECTDDPTEDQILHRVLKNHNADQVSSDEEEVLPVVPRPSMKTASEAIDTLRKFYEGHENSEHFFRMIMDLEDGIYKTVELKQKNILDYMCRPTTEK